MARKWIEKRKRGFFGWVFLLLFWGWNAFMVFAIFAGLNAGAPTRATLTGDELRAFDAGSGIAIMFELVLWAVGSVVFGLLAYFTRGRREMIEVEA